jgi:ABC-type uncharacterized transport system substrate-binding protein
MGLSPTVAHAVFWVRGCLAIALLCVPPVASALPKCLFVSSYHQGYAWSDGVERGLRQTLDGKCEIRQFDMDTKRHKDPADIRNAALDAKRLIEDWQPDIVITADDHAARHLIVPYFRDHSLPFVFCGVNWSVDEYGFPYRNVTGMIEVAPVKSMIEEAKALVPGAARVLYIGANTSTERKNAARLRDAANDLGLTFEAQFSATLQSWVGAYERAQEFDFVIIGSNAGINDWDTAEALAMIRPMTRRLTVTSHDWMMPVTMLGMTKVPAEQGEWAGMVALQILRGTEPTSIPIIANRKWDLYLNTALVDTAGIQMPAQLLSKSKVYR